MLFVCNAVGSSDCMGIHLDKIFRIAQARPTTVVHVTLHAFPCDGTQCQPVTVELRRIDGRATDGTVTRKQFVQLCGVKVLCSGKKKSGPMMACCVTIAVLKNVTVFTVEITDSGLSSSSPRYAVGVREETSDEKE